MGQMISVHATKPPHIEVAALER